MKKRIISLFVVLSAFVMMATPISAGENHGYIGTMYCYTSATIATNKRSSTAYASINSGSSGLVSVKNTSTYASNVKMVVNDVSYSGGSVQAIANVGTGYEIYRCESEASFNYNGGYLKIYAYDYR